MLRLGILGLGEGRSTMSAALASEKYELKTICDLSEEACKLREKELLELQKKSGKKVFVGQSSRFFEPAKRQRKDYEAGLIGELITIESHYHADHRWFLEKPWALEGSFKW